MTGHIAALYRHPVKGFTPERLSHAELTAGGPFPCDRLYAVENGPSGFDPCAPGLIPKQKFTVLALRRSDGKVLWERVVREELPHEGTHPTGTWASASVVTR